MTKPSGYRNFRASLRMSYPSWHAACYDGTRFIPARIGAALQRALDDARVRWNSVQVVDTKGVARLIFAATVRQDHRINGPHGCSRMVQAGAILDDIMVLLKKEDVPTKDTAAAVIVRRVFGPGKGKGA